jgi:hypothetical protein
MSLSTLILFREHNVCDADKYTKTIAQVILNCPLLSNLQNNLARKWPMAQKFLTTPLEPTIINNICRRNPSHAIDNIFTK